MSATAPADTIPGVLERAARDAPNQVALAAGSTAITYAELVAEARAAASGLIASGVGAGDRVALWAPNGVDWAVAHFGALFAAATVVPLNARYTSAEATDIIRRAGCRVVVGSDSLLTSDVRSALGAGGAAVAALGPGSGGPLAELVARAGAADRRGVEQRLAGLSPRAPSHVQFTSGTTGRPKGAMLRHGAMVATTAEWVSIVELGPTDRYPLVAPFSHIGGHKTGLLATITARATAYPFPALDVARLTETIARRSATFLQGPPTMYLALAEEARRDPARLRSLRVGVTGAATIAPSLVHAMREVIGLARVFTAYGLTEATGVCTMTRGDDPLDIVCSTSGRPIPSVAVRIAGPGGEDLPPGSAGEILVAGPHLMSGYLDDDEATADAIRDGWLHTGDIGRLDAAGNLQIVDRIKDMVVVGGLNVYPAEVERVLLEHPAVLDAAVVGAPDPRMGEVPAAFVRLSHPAPTDEVLVAFCRQRLAGFKVPRLLWALDVLPLNTAGKVDKVLLRRRAAERVR